MKKTGGAKIRRLGSRSKRPLESPARFEAPPTHAACITIRDPSVPGTVLIAKTATYFSCHPAHLDVTRNKKHRKPGSGKRSRTYHICNKKH